MTAAKATKAEKPAKAEKAPRTAKPKVAKKPPEDLSPYYQVILSPVITEKATNNSAFNQVTFRVQRAATKPQIRLAVEHLFGVKVTGVNTHNRQGKTKRFKGRVGFRQDVKFAVVTLAEGSKIDVTTGL
jgi:large subunit ribosomal protein L23